MRIKCYHFLGLSFLFLQGCQDEITDEDTKNKMLACSAAFDPQFQFHIKEHLDKSFVDNALDIGFEEGVWNIFNDFSNVPPPDRLKFYEDYINCIHTLKIKRSDTIKNHLKQEKRPI